MSWGQSSLRGASSWVGQWQQNVARPTMGEAQGAVGGLRTGCFSIMGVGKEYLSWVWEEGRKSAQRPLSAPGTHTPPKALEPPVFLKGTAQVRQAHSGSTKRVARPCPQSCSQAKPGAGWLVLGPPQQSPTEPGLGPSPSPSGIYLGDKLSLPMG